MMTEKSTALYEKMRITTISSQKAITQEGKTQLVQHLAKERKTE
jgi:hypothetical protein